MYNSVHVQFGPCTILGTSLFKPFPICGSLKRGGPRQILQTLKSNWNLNLTTQQSRISLDSQSVSQPVAVNTTDCSPRAVCIRMTNCENSEHQHTVHNKLLCDIFFNQTRNRFAKSGISAGFVFRVQIFLPVTLSSDVID